MTNRPLRQSEIDRISAFVDGELPPDQASETAKLIQTDPVWSAVANDFYQVDSLLETVPAPRLRRDLTQNILAQARRKPRRNPWIPWLAPLAAAATIVVAVWLSQTGPMSPPDDSGNLAVETYTLPAEADELIRNLPPEDQFVVENLDLFENYDVLIHYATLEALDQAEEEREET
jgi:anti-sigma factor RsiW